MVLEGSSIAAILTGVLALAGALGAAYMSGWNDRRTQRRKNRKALARYAVPLLISAWDLANWLYDIMEEANYSPRRCAAYGNGWNSEFTSYLIGSYFAAVHILRLKTHFLAHIKGTQGDALKRLLWKIQDEFVTMNYEDRESLEMRWFEGDILAVQEIMTEDCDLDGDGVKGEMQTIPWIDFQKMYAPKEDGSQSELKKTFDWYETEFQRVVYRRFKHLYSTKWTNDVNPQQAVQGEVDVIGRTTNEEFLEEERLITKEAKGNPNARLVIPDHRIRRLQHLLSDLVITLDEVSRMKFNRPIRRCGMLATDSSDRVPCDCRDIECNPKQQDFEHRQLHDLKSGAATRFYSARRTPTWPNTVGPKKAATTKTEEKYTV